MANPPCKKLRACRVFPCSRIEAVPAWTNPPRTNPTAIVCRKNQVNKDLHRKGCCVYPSKAQPGCAVFVVRVTLDSLHHTSVGSPAPRGRRRLKCIDTAQSFLRWIILLGKYYLLSKANTGTQRTIRYERSTHSINRYLLALEIGSD